MRRCLVVASLAFATATLAQAPADAGTPAVAAPATPPAEAKPVDPLQEPRDLVETAPNTFENLKKAIALYEERLKDASIPAKVRADGWADESRAWLRLGDLETKEDVKIAAYTKGREAAKKGIALDANHAEAIFWDMANQATIGRTKGVMNSLFMLPELRKGLGRVLELSPGHAYAKNTLGQIDHKVPGIVGGSDERAEKAYLEILKRDPHFTPTMHHLAELYKDKGRKDEAKKLLNTCISETHSSVPNDYKKFDKHDCQTLLKEME